MTALLRVARVVRPEAAGLVLGLVATLLSVSALTGLVLAAGAAPVLAGGVALAWALRGLGFGRVALRYVERLATHRATFRALTALRVWAFRGLARQAGGGLGFMARGDALARVVGDVDALDGLYLRVIVPLLAAVVLLIDVGVLLGANAPGLALAVAALLGLSAAGVPFVAGRMAAGAAGQVAQAASGLRVAALDTLEGMREVRAFGNEGRMLARVQAREGALLGLQQDLAHRASLAQAASGVCGQAALLLVVLHGLPGAVLLPAVLLTLAAFEAAAPLARAGVLAGQASAATGRVLALADGEPMAAVSGPVPPRSGIRFEAVKFGWPGRPVLFDGLTLDIPAGSRVAVLGPSGSGKSTLAALLLKVAAPDGGRITLGGADIAGLADDAVRSRVAWLSQSTHVFGDTVRANLLLARPGADDAALWRALALAGVDEVVRGLPDGLDTWIGAGGAGLSGGQARRVALARTLLSDAPVLLLDEPATGLDDAAERAFFVALNEALDASPGRTLVLIAHRLLGVERVDRIYRISGGSAVAAAG